MATGFRIFQAILKKISILISIFVKATLFFFKPGWGYENISHFLVSVPKRSNYGHYLQLPIAIANATILEIVLIVQLIKICLPFWSLKLILIKMLP